jgi:hypothetical protein
MSFITRKLKSEEFLRAAYHEAGHAFMAIQVGWSFSSVELDFKNSIQKTVYEFGSDKVLVEALIDSSKRYYDDNLITIGKKRAMILMAGMATEYKYTQVYGVNTFDQNTSTKDIECFTEIEAFLKRNFNVTLRGLMNDVETIVSTNWDNIELIAGQLITSKTGKLTRKQIDNARLNNKPNQKNAPAPTTGG